MTVLQARPSKADELRILVNSRAPIITIETAEEERAERLLVSAAAELAVPLFCWSVTSGLSREGGSAIYNTEQPEAALTNIALIQGNGIFLLKDFARSGTGPGRARYPRIDVSYSCAAGPVAVQFRRIPITRRFP